ncbi:MAG TPA: sugar-binding protein, partial [Spirochaetota bacterium]|nr:sugar-binding protein [Spirochaetota bacterium]
GRGKGRTVFIGGYLFALLKGTEDYYNYIDAKLILKNSIKWCLGRDGGMKVKKKVNNLRAIKPKEKNKRGHWVWQTSRIVKDKKETDLFFKFIKNRAIGTLFLYSGFDYFYGEYKEQFKNLIARAHDEGMRVEALDGDPNWADPAQHKECMEHLHKIVAYNKSVAPKYQFDGFQSDIEPGSARGYHGARHDLLINGYLEITAKLKKMFKSELGKDFIYGGAIWSTYDDKKEIATFQGKTQNMYKHLIDIYDYVALMDYYDRAEVVINKAQNEADYAAKQNKYIFIGQETMDLYSAGIGSGSETYYEEGVDKMETEIEKVYNHFKDHKGFHAIAVHCYKYYILLPNEETRGRKPATNIVAVKTTKDKKIDGSFNDWSGKQEIVLNTEKNVVYGPGAWDGPDDFSAKIYLEWDKNNIYAFYKITDEQPFVQKDTGADIWTGDHIEMFFNPVITNQDKNKIWQLGFSPGNNNNLSPEIFIWHPKNMAPARKQAAAKAIAYKIKKTASGYNAEIKIPVSIFKNMPPLKPGSVVAMTMDPSDTDEIELKQETLMSSSPVWKKMDPNSFVRVRFIK